MTDENEAKKNEAKKNEAEENKAKLKFNIKHNGKLYKAGEFVPKGLFKTFQDKGVC